MLPHIGSSKKSQAKTLATLCLLLVLAQSAFSQATPPRRQLFLVGDSISIYYTPDLKSDVEATFDLSRKASPTPESIADQLSDPQAQGGDSRMVLAYLKTRFTEPGFHPSAVLFNCGLHDVKRNPKTNVIAVDSAEYERNLREIVSLIDSHNAKPVWISTTPVDDARHNRLSKDFYRFNADVMHYNDIAAKVMTRLHVPTVDLYAFTAHLGNGHYIDHVHFDEGTRSLQAAYIAGFLNAWSEGH